MSELSAADILKAKSRGVTPHHIRALESLWTVTLRSLGDVPADSITFETLEDYIGRRREQGVRGQTIRRELAAVKRALTIAVRRRHIAELPSEWPEVRSGPPHPGKRGKLVAPDVIRMVLLEVPQDVRDTMEFALPTGLRAAEVQRLEAAWVEPTAPGSAVAALIRIPAHAAKNRRERIVGLTEPALALIRKRLEADPKAGRVFSQGAHVKALQRACKRLSVSPVVTLRDMRHTFATLALQGTADPTAVQSALGHSDLRTTQRYLSSTVGRTLTASTAVLDQLEAADETSTPKKRSKGAHAKGHTKSGRSGKTLNLLERATRFELATLSLGS
jgi:integrase